MRCKDIMVKLPRVVAFVLISSTPPAVAFMTSREATMSAFADCEASGTGNGGATQNNNDNNNTPPDSSLPFARTNNNEGFSVLAPSPAPSPSLDCDTQTSNARGYYTSKDVPCVVTFHHQQTSDKEVDFLAYHTSNICSAENRIGDESLQVKEYMTNWPDECVGDFARCYSLDVHSHILWDFLCRRHPEWELPPGTTHMQVDCRLDKDTSIHRIQKQQERNQAQLMMQEQQQRQQLQLHQQPTSMGKTTYITVTNVLVVLISVLVGLFVAAKFIAKPFLHHIHRYHLECQLQTSSDHVHSHHPHRPPPPPPHHHPHLPHHHHPPPHHHPHHPPRHCHPGRCSRGCRCGDFPPVSDATHESELQPLHSHPSHLSRAHSSTSSSSSTPSVGHVSASSPAQANNRRTMMHHQSSSLSASADLPRPHDRQNRVHQAPHYYHQDSDDNESENTSEGIEMSEFEPDFDATPVPVPPQHIITAGTFPSASSSMTYEEVNNIPMVTATPLPNDHDNSNATNNNYVVVEAHQVRNG